MEPRLNSEIFLATFNDLEKYFKNELFHGGWKSFKQMLKEGSRFNPIINRYKEELFEFTDLRNAIVHNASNDYQVIAEPHSFVVEQFIDIKNQIIHPVCMNTFFKKVYTCKSNQKFLDALQLMHEQLISQIPVLDENGNVVELLNTSCIANWLAARKNVTIDSILVSEVLEYKEFKKNFGIIPASTSIFHAAEIFKNSYKKQPIGRCFDALLITQNGKSNEEVKGIIVLSDIVEYL